MYFILMNKEVERSKVTQDALSLQNVVIEKVKKKGTFFIEHQAGSGGTKDLLFLARWTRNFTCIKNNLSSR